MSAPGTPVEQAQVDKVAEAIWRADINIGHRDFISEADVSWAEDIGAAPKQHYRRMAVAAIEALELTEETAFRFTHLASGRSSIIESSSSDVRVARKIAGTTHGLAEVSRLVGPWRTA